MSASLAQQRQTTELVEEAQRLAIGNSMLSIADIAVELGVSRPYASHLLHSSHSRIVVAAREAWREAHADEIAAVITAKAAGEAHAKVYLAAHPHPWLPRPRRR